MQFSILWKEIQSLRHKAVILVSLIKAAPLIFYWGHSDCWCNDIIWLFLSASCSEESIGTQKTQSFLPVLVQGLNKVLHLPIPSFHPLETVVAVTPWHRLAESEIVPRSTLALQSHWFQWYFKCALEWVRATAGICSMRSFWQGQIKVLTGRHPGLCIWNDLWGKANRKMAMLSPASLICRNMVSSQFLLLTSRLSPDFCHPLLRVTLPSLAVLQGPPFGSTKTFLTALSLFPELQAFAHHGRPLPRYQVALCFGEEFPDPQRQRKLITAHVSRTSSFAKWNIFLGGYESASQTSTLHRMWERWQFHDNAAPSSLRLSSQICWNWWPSVDQSTQLPPL